jgi:formylglycine-generating enzyme required for sulfatase activity
MAMGVAGWAGAEPPAPVWQVRELTLQGPARLPLAGGWFVQGSDEAELTRAQALCKKQSAPDCSAAQFAAETPARRVHVRSFQIDRLEVSAGAYLRCVMAGKCLPARPSDPPVQPDEPVVQVTWQEARDYCRFAGGDLPTEAQWEYAAHGNSQRSFPWGDELSIETGARDKPHAVFEHSEGKSFFGLLNMAGNVWELVLDRYVAPYSADLLSVDPLQGGADTAGERVLRGGSFRSPAHMRRSRYRAAIPENEARADVGFRCAYAAGRSSR